MPVHFTAFLQCISPSRRGAVGQIAGVMVAGNWCQKGQKQEELIQGLCVAMERGPASALLEFCG